MQNTDLALDFLNREEQKQKKDKRKRGEHSNVCKCSQPKYQRPGHYKNLPNFVGRAYRNLVKKDKDGNLSFRRLVSFDPIFSLLRKHVGRKRGFRLEKHTLLNAVYLLMICTVDQATDIVTLNISRMAHELSPKDKDGNPIDEDEYVTISRVSRLICELAKFGIIESADKEWDFSNQKYLPKHVIITEAGWRLSGIDIERKYAEQEEIVQLRSKGIISENEIISVKTARRRWFALCKINTLSSRENKSRFTKRRNSLLKYSLDVCKSKIANILIKKEGVNLLSPKEFNNLVWKEIYRLKLAPEQFHIEF